MKDGNEKITYESDARVRNIVQQLLLYSSILDYGHRQNNLNAPSTHVAYYYTRQPIMKAKWWIQEYGL